MEILDIINKKENKEVLSYDEIKFAVDNYVKGIIPDYQMSSFLMAILLNGMTFEETFNLTKIMIDSGDIIDLSKINGIVVDKHSTGGVGDKTSLVVLPLVASCNVKIAKMSGRGLGFTGGTIDKLESIPGFKTNISEKEFIDEVNRINIALVSQSGNLVPADKKIYALRDVTGTTESIPLIASSIMSKKLASSADKILLDVKVGKGAFMKDIEEARELAKTMVKIGNKYGKETIAILTNMDYPLGYTIGNSIEVLEAIDTLKENGESEFTKLCLLLSSYMVSLGKNISVDDAYEEVILNYKNHLGLEKFYEFIKSQGGDINNIPISNKIISIISDKDGYINDMDTLKLAMLCNDLGAGRSKKDDIINHKVGIKILKKVNDPVTIGEKLMEVFTEKEIDIEEFKNTISIGKEKVEEPKLVYEIIK